MQDWKQAFWLAKFELKASLYSFLGLFLFLIIMVLYFSTSISSYLENNFVGFDLFFILIFSVAMIWTKPKDFQSKKINENIFVSPSLVMLQHIPVKQQVIIKSRFIIHFVYSFPFQILLLVLMYLISPGLRDVMSVSTYIAFSIIWLSFGVYAGYIFPASDAGDRVNRVIMFVYSFLLIIVTIAVFTIVHLFFDYGIIHWTIIIAQKWPILSAIVSILLAILGFNYWQRYMKKTMEKLDYL